MTKEMMESKIYDVVRKIPRGFVMTYATVAALAELPSCARLVGHALHKNPDPSTIPCHRVVFKDGSASTFFAFGGKEAQLKLLRSEGVRLLGDKVDMAKHALSSFSSRPALNF